MPCQVLTQAQTHTVNDIRRVVVGVCCMCVDIQVVASLLPHPSSIATVDAIATATIPAAYICFLYHRLQMCRYWCSQCHHPPFTFCFICFSCRQIGVGQSWKIAYLLALHILCLLCVRFHALIVVDFLIWMLCLSYSIYIMYWANFNHPRRDLT